MVCGAAQATRYDGMLEIPNSAPNPVRRSNMDTVEKLAPYTFNTHFKDMAVEETETGFNLAEVPLGEGMLDLPRMVRAIRAARPRVRFSLEMITRDPLHVPCLTEKYWSTFTDVGGGVLARALTRMRASKPRAPLPTISGLSAEQRKRYDRGDSRRADGHRRHDRYPRRAGGRTIVDPHRLSCQ